MRIRNAPRLCLLEAREREREREGGRRERKLQRRIPARRNGTRRSNEIKQPIISCRRTEFSRTRTVYLLIAIGSEARDFLSVPFASLRMKFFYEKVDRIHANV